jgi:hypothetical protein
MITAGDDLGSKKSLTEFRQKTFKLGKLHLFIHQKAFDLMEHERMARIHSVGSIHTARHDDRQRRLVLFHGPHLSGGSMAAQQETAATGGWVRGV